MGKIFNVCKNCGARVHKTSNYCPNCWTKIEKPIYTNYAALFCLAIIMFTFGEKVVIHRKIDKVVHKLKNEITSITKNSNINISELENFLNGKESTEITSDEIKDFLKKELPKDVES